MDESKRMVREIMELITPYLNFDPEDISKVELSINRICNFSYNTGVQDGIKMSIEKLTNYTR